MPSASNRDDEIPDQQREYAIKWADIQTVQLPATDPQFIAGIVFGETSVVLADAGNASNIAAMTAARALIAEMNFRRKDQTYQRWPAGVAPSVKPTDQELQDRNIRARWEACVRAQAEGAASFQRKRQANVDANLRHYFMWPSDNARTPRGRRPDDPAGATWPFTEMQKIRDRFGPFTVQVGGETPAGTNIYIFSYAGVP